MRLQYVGQSHFRKISKRDIKSLDFDGEAISLARQDLPASQNPEKLKSDVEVSDDFGAWLLKNEPRDWKELKEGETPTTDVPQGELAVTPDGTGVMVGGAPSGEDGPETPASKSTRR